MQNVPLIHDMAKVIIIGGGVAGLTAGIYAQKAHLQSTIYERHTLPGGLLSWWQRKGFLLDNCVHWLTGTKPGTDIHQLWHEIGVLGDGIEVFQPKSFMQVEQDGLSLNLWRDIRKMRQEMLALSPEDAPHIEEFIRLLTLYKDTVVVADKPLEQYGLIEKAKLIWKMRHIGKVHRVYSKMSIPKYAERFRHPLIRKFLTAYFPKYYNVSSLFFVFGIFCDGNADLPAGGSRGMMQHAVARYNELGGTIQTGWEAERVHIQRKRAVSVQFRNGEVVEADFVVLACDLYHTMTRLLPVGYMDKYMWERFMDTPEKHPTYSSVNLYYSVAHTTTGIPDALVLDLEGVDINGTPAACAFLKHFNYEPSFAPEGQSVLQVLITQYEPDYAYWSELRKENYQSYKAEKRLVAQAVAQNLMRRFPELEGCLDLLDVCTPATNYRFCNTYKGAYMSFCLTPDNEKVNHNGRIKGIDNLYLAGQWLQAPGGLPNAAVTGKFAIQRLLHDHRGLSKGS